MEQYKENSLSHQDPLVGVSQWQETNNYQDSDDAIKMALYDMEIRERDWEEAQKDGHPWHPPRWIPVEPEIRRKWDEIGHQKFEAMLGEGRRQEFLKKTSGTV